MIFQANNWNMLQMLEKLSAQAIFYRPQANGPTGISNADDDGISLQFDCEIKK